MLQHLTLSALFFASSIVATPVSLPQKEANKMYIKLEHVTIGRVRTTWYNEPPMFCIDKCATDPTCLGYSHPMGANPESCEILLEKLRDVKVGESPTQDPDVTFVTREALTDKQYQSITKGQFLVYPGIESRNYIGQDVDYYVSLTGCQNNCKSREDCSGCSCNQFNAMCSMISPAFKLEKATGKRFFLLDSQTLPTKTFTNVKKEVSWQGDVISEVDAGEECTRYCSLLSDCKGFSYTGRKCQLFSTIRGEAPSPGATSMQL